MATNTDLKVSSSLLPNRKINDSTVLKIFNPSQFVTAPAAADIIALFDLPAGAYVLDAALRIKGQVGATSSSLKLQQQSGTQTAQDLTVSISASVATNARMTAAPYTIFTSTVTTIQLLVGTASILTSLTSNVEVYVNYEDNMNTI